MRAFPVFFVCYVLSQFFRSFLAVIAPNLAADVGLTDAGLGGVSAIWFLTFAFAQVPVGYALDRFGPRRTVPLLMLAAVAGALVFASARSFLPCALGMALIGLGSSPIYMGAIYVFARTEPPARFATLASVLVGLGSLGNLLGTTPLAYASLAFGWRWTFVAISGLTALAAALFWSAIKDPPRATTLAGKDDATTFGAAVPDMLLGIGRVLAIKGLLPILPVALVSYAIILVERGLWAGPFLYEVHGLDTAARGNALVAMAVMMAIGSILYGPMDRIFGSRKRVAVVGMAATALGFLGMAFIPAVSTNPNVATLMLAGIGAAGMTYGVILAHARAFLPEELMGRGLTFINALFIGGAGLLQPLSGNAIAQWRQLDMPVATIYADLHLGFAVVLILALLIYLSSEDR